MSGFAGRLFRKAVAGSDPFIERAKNIKLVAFDFDGVFTDNTVYVLQDGSEAVRCWRGDGIGLHKLDIAGIKAMIISREGNLVVAHRAQKLGIQAYVGVQNKLDCLTKIVDDLGLDFDQVAFVGNDDPDLPCLEVVGVPIVVADADLGLRVRYRRTEHKGGQGAVREICDWLVKVRGQ